VSKASRWTLGPTHLLTQGVPSALSQGVKEPGREPYFLPPSGAEINYACSYASIPPCAFRVKYLISARTTQPFPFYPKVDYDQTVSVHVLPDFPSILPEARPTSCTMDTGSFPGLIRPERGTDQCSL